MRDGLDYNICNCHIAASISTVFVVPVIEVEEEDKDKVV